MKDISLPSESVSVKEAHNKARVPLRRTLLAYLMWLFGGWFGLHRFYLGHWFMGLLYAGTLGFLGIGWLIDGFLIPRYLKKRAPGLWPKSPKQRQTPETLHEEEELLDSDVEHEELQEGPILAPWAEEGKTGFFFNLQLLIGSVFYLFAPMILVAVAILFQQWALMVIMVGILLFTNFLEQVRGMLATHEEQIKKLPFMKETVKHFYGFYEFYMEEKPRGFLYYLFYFPVGFITMIFSERAREECKLYMRIFGAIAAALIMGTLSSQKELFGSYVPFAKIIQLIIVNLILMFLVIVLYMMPTMTTAFTLSLSGKRRRLRGLTFVALSIALLIGAVGMSQERNAVSFSSRSILLEKFRNKTYQQEIQQLAEMFLRHQVKQVRPQSQPWAYQSALTDRLRTYTKTLASGNQSNAFHILSLQRGHAKGAWLFLLYKTNREKTLFFGCAPNGWIARSWQALPKDVQAGIQQAGPPPHEPPSTEEKKKTTSNKSTPFQQGLFREFIARLPSIKN